MLSNRSTYETKCKTMKREVFIKGCNLEETTGRPKISQNTSIPAIDVKTTEKSIKYSAFLHNMPEFNDKIDNLFKQINLKKRSAVESTVSKDSGPQEVTTLSIKLAKKLALTEANDLARNTPPKKAVGRQRKKRGILGYGHDSINPFEDARIFLFNPLCCFGWKAADMEMSNMKNWLRDIRTTVG